MNTPFMLRALALAAEVARLQRELTAARAGWDTALGGWNKALDAHEEALRRADGWQARAEILYALVEDREACDEALRAQDGIEAWLTTLEEVDP